jgi:hypothetical protein
VRSSPPLDADGRETAGGAAQSRARAARGEARTLDGASSAAGYNRASIDFENIKRLVSLPMVLAHYAVDTKRSGAQLIACCPIHGGSNPKEFVAHANTGLWHCFKCKAGGSTLDFVALKEGITTRAAAHRIAEWYSIACATGTATYQPPARSRSMNKQPSHRAYVVEDPEGDQTEQKGFWTQIGSAWPHKDGKGLNLQLKPGIAVSGRVVLREWSDEDQRSRGKSAQ